MERRGNLAPDHHLHVGAGPRQEQRRLAGGVAAAHDDDGPPAQAWASICVAA